VSGFSGGAGLHRWGEHAPSPPRGFKRDEACAQADGKYWRRNPTEPGLGAEIYWKSKGETDTQ